MSRTRVIKPTFFRDGDLFDAEVRTKLPLRLAYSGLWCVADREGRFLWKPRELKPDVLPYDDCDFSAVLDGLETHGFIERYVVDGKTYGYIPNFHKHQKPHPRETRSLIPHPPEKPAEGESRRAEGGPRLRSVEPALPYTEVSEAETETVSPVLEEFEEFRTENPQVVDNWLRKVPTAPAARLAFVAETNKALQEGLPREALAEAMRDWIAAELAQRSLGLWRQFLRKAQEWQDTGRKKKAQSDPNSPAEKALHALLDAVSRRGGFKFYPESEYRAWPPEVHAGIKSAGGIQRLTSAEGDDLEKCRVRFVQGYNQVPAHA